jgi:hypothetical protein
MRLMLLDTAKILRLKLIIINLFYLVKIGG